MINELKEISNNIKFRLLELTKGYNCKIMSYYCDNYAPEHDVIINGFFYFRYTNSFEVRKFKRIKSKLDGLENCEIDWRELDVLNRDINKQIKELENKKQQLIEVKEISLIIKKDSKLNELQRRWFKISSKLDELDGDK